MTTAQPRVLFVDDTSETRTLFRLTAEYQKRPWGFASNGAECLERYREANELGKPFDLIILDIAMPDMSGIEVAREIRNAGDCDVKIVFFSGYDNALNRMAADELGISGYWMKPTTVQAVQMRIEALFSGAEPCEMGTGNEREHGGN